MKPFRKRTYTGLLACLCDWSYLLGRLWGVVALMRGKSLSSKFRERLMLAVTQVNDCRYCTFFHTKAALSEGVPREEVERLMGGMFEGCPKEELPALLYAQHWAETERKPDPAMRQKLVDTYGAEKAEAIELTLRFICACNYSGNSLDYILYRLSFGKIGG
jgi:AhpD family alkylhydroperoxidase